MSSHAASRDQHDERHLPDGTPSGQNGLKRNDSPDEEMLRMLQEYGLDPSTPVDSSSLKALQQLVCTPKTCHNKTAAMPAEDSKQPALPTSALDGLKEHESNSALHNAFRSPHVPPEVLRPIDFRRVTSDLTQGHALLRSASGMEEETDASTAGSTQGASAEKLILDHLQLQTALLMDLQRRVDELSQIVISMHQQQHRPGFPPTLHFQQPGNMSPPPQFQQPRNVFPEDQQRPPPAGDVGPPPPRPEMFVLARLTRVYEAFVSIPSLVRSSRMTELWRVFWALHRRDMGNRLDGNLLLKIIFMGLVVTAKLTASNKRKKKGSSSSLHFGLAIVLILVGFLLQTGYYRFFHNFFVKEKYPQRIWNGETINVAAQPPPRPPAAADAAAAQQNPQRAAAAPPQHGILRGGIARANPQVGVRRVLTDILYLFGTLILSILPMWKAEPLQPQGPQEEEEEGDNQRQQNEEQEGGGGGDGM
jgi:hypothetical protein